MIDRDPPVTQDELHAYVDGELPEGKDPELEELMRKRREEKPYDPRRDRS